MNSTLAPVIIGRDLSVWVGSKDDRRQILHGIDVEVRPGEVLGLIGPNGAGKSSLLALLSGDRDPDSGEVLLGGHSYRELGDREAAQRRSVMLQDTSVSFSFTVHDVVRMGRSAWPKDPARDEKIVDDALAKVDLTHLADRDITTLSGGERARAALARVIAQDSRLVMLDEPTAAMDIGHAERTLLLVRRLAAEGRAVLIVIHDLSTAAQHCDRVVLLSGGRVYAHGTPQEVFTTDNLSHVYGWPIKVTFTDTGPWIRPGVPDDHHG